MTKTMLLGFRRGPHALAQKNGDEGAAKRQLELHVRRRNNNEWSGNMSTRHTNSLDDPRSRRFEKEADQQDDSVENNAFEQQSWRSSESTSLDQKAPVVSDIAAARKTPTRNKAFKHRWSTQNFQAVVDLWSLDTKEQNKLRLFQGRVSDVDHWLNDPFELVRFLKEKQGNVDKAEQMFQRVVEWRRLNNIDTILEDYKISPLFKYFPVANLAGVDKEGDPIHIERPGVADCWGFYKRFGPDETTKMCLYMRELDTRRVVAWQQHYEQEHGHSVRQFTIIIDLKGLNSHHMRPGLLPLLHRILRMSQDNYPFFAKRVIFLRAPAIFKVLYSIAQHFLNDNIKNLLIFTTHSDYQEVLDKYVDREVLPPCIFPEEGEGRGTVGYENICFEGGPLPAPHEEIYTDPPVESFSIPVENQNDISILTHGSDEDEENVTRSGVYSNKVVSFHELAKQESTPLRVICQPIAKGYFK